MRLFNWKWFVDWWGLWLLCGRQLWEQTIVCRTIIRIDGHVHIVEFNFYWLIEKRDYQLLLNGFNSVERNIIPLAYILMSRKNDKRVDDSMISLRALFNPSSFRITSNERHRPQSSVHCCFFHLTQNISRQVTLCNSIWKRWIICTCSTNASLKTNDIYSSFEDIADLQMSDFDLLDNSFEDDYIDQLRSRKRRTSPTFPITFWNVHNLLTNQFDHTNHAIDDLIISLIQLILAFEWSSKRTIIRRWWNFSASNRSHTKTKDDPNAFQSLTNFRKFYIQKLKAIAHTFIL